MRQRTGRLFGAGLSFLLVVLMCAGVVSMVVFADAETTIKDPVEGAIYFDLAAGNVTIGGSTYSGKVYVDGTAQDVKGNHKAGNKYYIYQSNLTDPSSPGYFKNTGYESGADWNPQAEHTNCRVPKYDRVEVDTSDGKKPWTEFITNNTNVEDNGGVIRTWESVAPTFHRTSTEHHITFSQESGYTADVIIDNIWSNYFDKDHGVTWRESGGIGAHLPGKTNTHIKLTLKGDNRVGCVHYSADKLVETERNTIEFFAYEEGNDKSGSITVADFSNNLSANHWNSAIGAADNPGGLSNDKGNDRSDGIIIHSGVIYAGTTRRDNCTAIGGGGNNYGGVTIEGGIVTAVVSSTGAAIGGGIGYSDPGGDTDVIINGGEIYAYNMGIDYTGTGGAFSKFVPSAAIGGGGSNNSAANLNANVTITGGKIYAQSMGGPAIGGGSSAWSDGGGANITIKGGTIIANSMKKEYNGQTISESTAIGGGTGNMLGGSVKLDISGKETIIRAGSIGGGKATNSKNIGSANVTISGGDIVGQTVMASGTNTQCTFDMSGGTIHDTDVIGGFTVEPDIQELFPAFRGKDPIKIAYIRDDGGAVWIEDQNGKATITGGTIKNCTAKRGGAVYMVGGTFTMKGGTTTEGTKTEGTIKGNTAAGGTTTTESGETSEVQGLGGGVCVYGGDVRMNGGAISGNRAENGGGVYVNQGNVTVVKGNIDGNDAANNGGGICIVATEGGKALNVKMLSGSLSRNKAGNNGGGMAVEGDVQQAVTVEMGCMLDHNLEIISIDQETELETYKPRLPIDYKNDKGFEYAEYQTYCVADGQINRHESCPAVKDNSSGKIGGAIHIDCSSATLKFYCMNESGNKTGNEPESTPEDKRAPAIQVDGGTVDVGDKIYHNDLYNEEHGKDALTTARGYISIESNVLVQAGKVNVFGSLTNPKMDHIVAKIEVSDKDLFIDHRFSKKTNVYWLRYNENFKNGTGYVSYDYSVFDLIDAKNAPATHDGYIFRGWCTASEYKENEEKLKLYQPGDEISKKSIEQTYQDVEETVYCDQCKAYIEGRLKVLYGIWDRLYTLKMDEDTTVRDAVDDAWEITYIKSEWDPETDKFVVPVLPEGEAPSVLGADPAEMLSLSQVTFTPNPASSGLPLTLAFEDDTGNKVVESLERLAGQPDGYTIRESASSSFTVTVTKDENGVYTLTMPAKHVTVSSVWELYLDYGTIELFKDGFRQQDYPPYHLTDPTAVNAWEGDYRIWQCEDNNQGPEANHTSYTGTSHAFHPTGNVLKLHDDLTTRADLTGVERKITLGNLNISRQNSIELADGAQVKLTQTGKLKAKNILVPTGAALTLTPNVSGPTISLKPEAGAAIGSAENGGRITLQNVKLNVSPGASDAYVVNGSAVDLKDCSIGKVDAPVTGQLHATESLKITGSWIYQQ